jgi:zinc protease
MSMFSVCSAFRLPLCAAIVCVAGMVASAEPLPTDPSLVTGKLDNGLEYIVRRHAVPPGRANIWIHFHSGSLNETDRQRGIAHYLEHMAFNGSTNFAPGELVPYFQSLGLTFGRDQNAFTNMQETTYQLSFPNATLESIGKGMVFFSDVVSGLSLFPKEIEAERQIIQEERRRSLSGRQRTGLYVLEHLTPGSLFGHRMTIGTEETINSVNQDDFKDYYNKWYGASNATLIVLADTDPADVVRLINEKFASAPKKPRPVPQELNVKAYDKSFAIVTSDKEIRTGSLRITRLEPARPATTTVEQMRDDLVLGIAESCFDRRMRNKIDTNAISCESLGVSSGNDSNAIYTTEVSASVAPDKWQQGLQDMATELQRARAFGFTPREIEDAKKAIIAGAERAVETEATAEAATVLRRINSNVGSGEPTMSPQQRLDLLRRLLPEIEKPAIDARFAKEFEPTAVAFIAVLPAEANVPSESELLDLGLKALTVKPTQDSESARATQLMAELPKGGTLAEFEEHSPTHVWSGWLSNNVAVHYRFMDERKNEATVTINLYGGELLETAENRGITSAAQLAWSNRSTKNLTSADIRELMTGKKVNVGGGGFGGGGGRRGGGGGGGGGDNISLSISGSPEEFETGFQLAYLLLTEPRIEQPAFERFQSNMKLRMEEMLKSPQGVFMQTMRAAPFPDGEPRAAMVTPQQIDKITLPAAQAWLEKLIKESPIEVTIVGDISREKAMDLVAKYLGSLPSRERVSTKTYASLRSLKRPQGPRVIEKTVVTDTPQAQVFSGFYNADDSNLADVRAMSMAARIMSTRFVKEVREKEQLVYSMGAGSTPGSTYPGFGLFSASAPTEPHKAPALVSKIAEMYEAFAKSGPTEEELDVARKQLLITLEEDMKTPGFWAGRLASMNMRGSKLDDIAGMLDAYRTMTTEQVKTAFAKYYAKENAVVVVVKPETQPDATK